MADIFEMGPIRPPSEAESLLLRVTRNCPWNKCRFCSLYRGQRFQTRTAEEIKADIDTMFEYKQRILNDIRNDSVREQYENLDIDAKACYYSVYNWISAGMESAFLQDASSLALKPEKLAEIIIYFKSKFPEIKRITSYARADILDRLTADDLKLLADAGISRIHSGYESGSDKVLKLINKGITKRQQIDAGKKVKEAGMELSVYYMPGLGGKFLADENAAETADVINAVEPDFVRIRTFVAKKESDIYASVLSGEFEESTDVGKLAEIKKFILALDENTRCTVKSDHIINLLEEIEGRLPDDRNKIMGVIEEFEHLPEEEQKIFQLARRMGFVRKINDLQQISENHMRRIKRTIEEIPGDAAFEDALRQLLMRYI